MSIELIDETKVSELTGIKVSTLQFFRREGRGPSYTKIGRLVRYQYADIVSWIQANKIATTNLSASNSP